MIGEIIKFEMWPLLSGFYKRLKAATAVHGLKAQFNK